MLRPAQPYPLLSGAGSRATNQRVAPGATQTFARYRAREREELGCLAPSRLPKRGFLLTAILEPGAGALKRLEPFEYLRTPPSDRLRAESERARKRAVTVAAMDRSLAQSGQSHHLRQSYDPIFLRRHPCCGRRHCFSMPPVRLRHGLRKRRGGSPRRPRSSSPHRLPWRAMIGTTGAMSSPLVFIINGLWFPCVPVWPCKECLWPHMSMIKKSWRWTVANLTEGLFSAEKHRGVHR